MSQMRSLGIRGDEVSFTAAIDACAQQGQWSMSLSLLDKMRVEGTPPTVRSFTAAISACGKGQQWARAVALLREMEAAGVPPNEVRSVEIRESDRGKCTLVYVQYCTHARSHCPSASFGRFMLCLVLGDISSTCSRMALGKTLHTTSGVWLLEFVTLIMREVLCLHDFE